MENKIPGKDTKLLWGKGAALCSMEECRALLVAEASNAVPSQHELLGECCHIVADKKAGPRGVSAMPMKDRKHFQTSSYFADRTTKSSTPIPRNGW